VKPAFGYRADVDGLRAMAILLVLAFHAFPNRVPGGFVGVDVFFAVSGYLITGIVAAAERRGEFSYARFYANRIRRLVPALSIVLAAATAAGALLLRPHAFADLGAHVAAGAAFVGNVVLWREGGYFNAWPLLRPMLHLWSLGVEEQFYLLWPALIVIAIRRDRLAVAIVLAGIASFGAGLWLIHRDYVAAFYLPFGRIWEMAAGGALAARDLRRGSAAARSILSDAGVAAGVALILASSLFFSQTIAFPGWRALLPVAGTVLVIACGRSSSIGAALGSRPLVYIGLISYPLYLWHWPALSLATIAGSDVIPSWRVRVALLAASGALAALTFELVEKPIRWGRRGPGTRRLVVALGVAALAGAFVWAAEGVPSRVETAPSFAANRDVLRSNSFAAAGTIDCRDDYDRSPGAFCRSVAAPAVAVLGDSHAMRLFVGLIRTADPVFGRAMAVGREACSPGAIVPARSPCADAIERAATVIEGRASVRTVLVTGAADPEAVGPRFVRLLSSLLTGGRRVYYVKDVPRLPFDPDTCIAARPFERLTADRIACTFPRAMVEAPRAVYNQRVQNMTRQLPAVRVFDPVPLFCDASTCRVLIDGRLQYLDRGHLSDAGAERVAAALIQQAR
jgi:peptidoglycan/LPS O-acetylase OafA/YrhL